MDTAPLEIFNTSELRAPFCPEACWVRMLNPFYANYCLLLFDITTVPFVYFFP
jgi:hypothetical protein